MENLDVYIPEEEFKAIIKYIDSIGGCNGLLYVGAGTGQELNFCKKFAKKIYAFEPITHPILWEELKKHADVNTLLYDYALSDTVGTAKIYPASNEFQSSSILQPTNNCIKEFNLNFGLPVEVKTERLQNLSFFKECDVLFMDVQGAELKVLNGIDDFSNLKLIVTEYTNCVDIYQNACTFDDIYQKLISKGFHFCQTSGTYISPNSNLLHGNATFRKL